MAKIKNIDPNTLNAIPNPLSQKKRSSKTDKIKGFLFSKLVAEQEVSQSQSVSSSSELIEASIAQIEQLGWALEKKPSKSTLREYRRLIQLLLRRSLDNLYQIDNSLGRLNHGAGSRKKYQTITMINQELEAVVFTVLERQNANLHLLDRLERIKGLLVNLLS